MKYLFILAFTFSLFSCGTNKGNSSKQKAKVTNGTETETNIVEVKTSGVKVENSQENPVWVVEQIFKAAKTKDFSLVNSICDPNNKNDGAKHAKDDKRNEQSSPFHDFHSFVSHFKKSSYFSAFNSICYFGISMS